MKITIEFTLEEFDEYRAYLKNKRESSYKYPNLPDEINCLELPTMFENILKNAGITTTEILCNMTRQELLGLRNMGKRGVKEIEDSLANFGIGLKIKE
jgi:DNA-directed RNA polymerase alpha subunit